MSDEMNKYKVFRLSGLTDQGFDFENLTYILLGKGSWIACEYDEEIGWFPMCGENQFTSKLFAEQAIADRIRQDKEIDQFKKDNPDLDNVSEFTPTLDKLVKALNVSLSDKDLTEGARLIIEDILVPDFYEVPGLATAPIKLHKDLIDLDSHRALKEADADLSKITDMLGNLTEEQFKQLNLQMRRDAAIEDPTITIGDEHDSKDIYLRTKIGVSDIYSIVGLHAIGHAGPYEYDMHHLDGRVERIHTNFMALETWGNEYDDEKNMLGRGSFRLHTHDIESYAKEMEAEGWERYEGPKRKPNP